MEERKNIQTENSGEEQKNSIREVANENISQEQTIESTQPETQNVKLETENMEVHHHPKVEKKKFKEYFLGILNAISCGNDGIYCREYKGRYF